MVCFEGRDQVHGLFDFLLNELTKSDDVDVPLLLSPTPFLHGALSLAQPKVTVVGVLWWGTCLIDWHGTYLSSRASSCPNP